MSVSKINSKIKETSILKTTYNPTRVLIRPACLKIETRRHGVSLCCSIINMMFSSDTLSKNEDGLTQNSVVAKRHRHFKILDFLWAFHPSIFCCRPTSYSPLSSSDLVVHLRNPSYTKKKKQTQKK